MLKFAVGTLFGAGAGLFGGAVLNLLCVEPYKYGPFSLVAMGVGAFVGIVLFLKWLDEREMDGAHTKAESPEASPY